MRHRQDGRLSLRNASTALSQQDSLTLPLHKRAVVQRGRNDQGQATLTIYLADKEISFDDEAMFAFGESLVSQAQFLASDAVAWGVGYEWETVAPMLEALLDDGVLHRSNDEQSARRVAPSRLMPPPLPQAPKGPARTWTECESLSEDLCGKVLDLGHLELVVPVFRVAHPALDQDGRQIGEANVFPPALRIETATEWRACPHSGTRYQAPEPMNITAMRTMRAHWPQMMQALSVLREAYLSRFPLSQDGWSVADVERLATLVLAVPTYALMRKEHPVRSGDLHPVLSSLFRVTDGLRMSVHQMLFVPGAEANLDPAAIIDSAFIYAYAERNYNFHSAHGVCAGPRLMIEEFLSVLIDGRAPRDTTPVTFDIDVAEALSQVDLAYDYGLLGLQAHFIAFSQWPSMSRAIAQISEQAHGRASTFWSQLVAMGQQVANASYHSSEDRRSAREATYGKLARDCNQGLATAKQTPIPNLWISDIDRARFARLSETLRSELMVRVGQGYEQVHAALLDYVLSTHLQLRTALQVQSKLNVVLGRETPVRAFLAQDMQIHLLIQQRDGGVMPHLIDVLAQWLGLTLTVTASEISLTMTPQFDVTAVMSVQEFVGIPPSKMRAPRA